MNLEELSDEQLQQLLALKQAQAPAQAPISPIDQVRNQWMASQAEQLSPWDAFWTGAGKFATEVGGGVQKMLGIGDQEELGRVQGMYERGYEPIQQAHPVATAAGEMALPLASAALPGGLVAQTAYGGLMEGARYGDDQLWQGITGAGMSAGGGAAGMAVNQIIRRGTNMVSSMMGRGARPASAASGETGRLVERADDLGMTISPGAAQDSMPLQQLEASIRSNPALSGVVEPMIQRNQEVVNRLAMEAIGESGEVFTPTTLGRASRRIGDVYKRAASEVDNVNLRGIDQRIAPDIGEAAKRQISSYMDDYPGLSTGVMDGKDFLRLRENVNRQIRSGFKTNPGLAEDLIIFQKEMDRRFAQVASPEYVAELQEAGRQWLQLKALESGKVITGGNVNPRSLDTALRRLDRGGYMRGWNDSDYYDSVRIANWFSDVVGDSGTATRSYLRDIATNPLGVGGYAAMRPVVRRYFESGGSPAMAGLVGVVPGNRAATQVGAGAGRTYAGR